MATTLKDSTTNLSSIVAKHKDQVLTEWIREMSMATRRGDLMKDSELHAQCSRFLDLLAAATAQAGNNFQSSAYDAIRTLVGEFSRTRVVQGFTPTETATFVFSIKRPCSRHIQP